MFLPKEVLFPKAEGQARGYIISCGLPFPRQSDFIDTYQCNSPSRMTSQLQAAVKCLLSTKLNSRHLQTELSEGEQLGD